MKNSSKMNLGCGKDIRQNYLNIDFEKFVGVDRILNLNNLPYPFKNNQFEEIIMQDILEHLDNPFEVMKEIYRISKPEAKIYLRVPHFSSNNIAGDIQHKRGFNTETFTNPNMRKMFIVKKQRITFGRLRKSLGGIINLYPRFYERHFAYILPAVNIEIELRVNKSNENKK